MVDDLTTRRRSAAIELQCRLAEAVDRRDWPALLACYTSSATTDLPKTGRSDGPEEMLEAARTVIERLDATLHHLSNHLVRVIDDHVVATCLVVARHVRGVELYTFGGRYTDTLVEVGTSLLIDHRRLEVIWTQGDAAVLDP